MLFVNKHSANFDLSSSKVIGDWKKKYGDRGMPSQAKKSDLKSAKICSPEGNNYCLSLAWIPCKSSSLDKCSSIHIIIDIMKPLWNKWLRQVKFVCFIHSTHAAKLGKEESGKITWPPQLWSLPYGVINQSIVQEPRIFGVEFSHISFDLVSTWLFYES